MGYKVVHETRYLLDIEKLHRLLKAQGMSAAALRRRLSERYGVNLKYGGFNRLLLNQNNWLLTYAWVVADSFGLEVEDLFRAERDDSRLEETVRLDLAALEAEEQPLMDGTPVERYVNTYERNPALRALAIRLRGTICEGCGFDFAAAYGERGHDFIEVHHIHPLSGIRRAVAPDPREEMAVLCANCHRMVHRRHDDVLSMPELRKIIRGARRVRTGK